MTQKPSLAKHLQTEPSPARLARLWDGVTARVESGSGRRRRALGWLAACAGALVLAAALAVVLRPSGAGWVGSSFDEAALETAGDSLVVDLKDGSRIELDARTRVEVEESTESSLGVRLRRGRVECDLVPRAGRHFTLRAAGVEVRVIGTRFAVELGPDNAWVDVAVERGMVEVRSPLGAEPERRLAAGERWSIDLRPGKPVLEPEPSASATPAGSASESQPRPATPDIGPAPGTSASPDTNAAPAPTSSAPPSARELLDAGNAARRAGDHRGAATAYELLLARYPSDPRAGLAAFELGRLRMGTLGDATGAAQAFRRAIALAPGAGFREDAMARLVDAYSALGQQAQCRAARDRYLKEYPRGLHAGGVAQKCGGR